MRVLVSITKVAIEQILSMVFRIEIMANYGKFEYINLIFNYLPILIVFATKLTA